LQIGIAVEYEHAGLALFILPENISIQSRLLNSPASADLNRGNLPSLNQAIECGQRCLGIALPTSNAVSQQEPLKELIVGTWLLDAVYDKTQDGEKHYPWGDGVKGQATFTSDGHFSWQMMSANRPKADTSPREPVGPVVAYWGTYTVDESAKTLTDHLESCTFPQWDGIYWYP
jgi:hypothetical protein